MYTCFCRRQVIDAIPAHLQGKETKDYDYVIQIGRPSPNPSSGEGSGYICNKKLYILPSLVEGAGEGPLFIR